MAERSRVGTLFAQNMKEDWCWAQERGLPKPDLVLFLELPLEKAARRNGYGNEQYENYDFQKKVLKNYNKMMDSTWRVSMSNPTIGSRDKLKLQPTFLVLGSDKR